MKKLIALVLIGSLFAFAPVAFAAEEAPEQGFIERTIEVALVVPRFAGRFGWGIVKTVDRIGIQTLDKAFETIGKALGTEPNTPLWE